jgi:hypothetical protein
MQKAKELPYFSFIGRFILFFVRAVLCKKFVALLLLLDVLPENFEWMNL